MKSMPNSLLSTESIVCSSDLSLSVSHSSACTQSLSQCQSQKYSEENRSHGEVQKISAEVHLRHTLHKYKMSVEE